MESIVPAGTDKQDEGPRKPCPACGGGVTLDYLRHCARIDCDHKYCGDRLKATCTTCRWQGIRLPLTATERPGGGA